MNVEQAIFTSARTDRFSGYQLVAASPGICEADARELATWGPSHDSLLESGSAAVSVNFFALPSGAFCVSQSTPEGPELSGRGGSRVYTQALVISPDSLARFANNPFAVWRAALAQGTIGIESAPPARLPPCELVGHAAAVDEALLGQLAAEPGAEWVAAVVDAALRNEVVGVSGGRLTPKLISGVINCLPVECRTQFSFTTGLRYSSSRPFRLAAITDSPAEQRRLQRQFQMQVVAVGKTKPTVGGPGESWGGFVGETLKSGRIGCLARQLRGLPAGWNVDRLSELASELLARGGGVSEPDARRAPRATESRQFEPPTNLGRQQRADCSHRRFGSAANAAVADHPVLSVHEPSAAFAMRFPQAVERMQAVEDVIFESLAGKVNELEALPRLWHSLLAISSKSAAGELREAYLRFAIEMWRELGADNPDTRHRLAAPAMEIVGLIAAAD